MKKTIKAWAVIDLRKSAPQPIVTAHVEMWEGCGSPETDALGIYQEEQEAVSAKSELQSKYYVVVPCTITFTIPKTKQP